MSQLERVEAQLAFNEGRALYSQMSLSLYEGAIPNFTNTIQLDTDWGNGKPGEIAPTNLVIVLASDTGLPVDKSTAFD